MQHIHSPELLPLMRDWEGTGLPPGCRGQHAHLSGFLLPQKQQPAPVPCWLVTCSMGVFQQVCSRLLLRHCSEQADWRSRGEHWIQLVNYHIIISPTGCAEAPSHVCTSEVWANSERSLC